MQRVEPTFARALYHRGASTSALRATVDRTVGKRHEGWTLIELMIVISLIVLLAGMATTYYGNTVVRANEAVLKEDLFRMRDALDQYYADKNKYPDSLESLVSDNYLRAIPRDPMTQSADTWEVIESEPDPSNPSSTPGVFNVKSGSDKTALDGSRYAEW